MDINEWADLYGEWDTVPEPKKPKNGIWCKYCETWISPFDLKHWNTDDEMVHFLCPGCDNELLEPEER